MSLLNLTTKDGALWLYANLGQSSDVFCSDVSLLSESLMFFLVYLETSHSLSCKHDSLSFSGLLVSLTVLYFFTIKECWLSAPFCSLWWYKGLTLFGVWPIFASTPFKELWVNLGISLQLIMYVILWLCSRYNSTHVIHSRARKCWPCYFLPLVQN